MAQYTKEHHELPWEMVFVTGSGNFRSSDLLRIPGLPEFEPCTYDGEDDSIF